MLRNIAIAVSLGIATPALSDTCPAHVMDEGQLVVLYEDLRTAENFRSAKAARNGLWQIWTDAPDTRSQELLDGGVERIRMSDFGTAIKALSALVDYCPEYAEGYNQRAFAHFLKGDYPAALADLDQALEINPEHTGALSGKGLTLMNLGRDADALKWIEAAVALDPWLNERGLIPVLKKKLGIEDL